MKTGEQITELPWKWGVQGKIFTIGGLGYMFDAWDVALNGVLTPLLGSYFPVLYCCDSELYPTQIRASGLGYASSVSRVATGFAPLLFGSGMWPILRLPLTFGIVTAFVLFAIIWMAYFAPVTKGRELDTLVDDTPHVIASEARV
ncbi:MFS transporter [Rhodococcus sp. NBC_00297]|uniref:MFS transporter n=1 Tax=Rhodococcus sp. NBC_00297 TaxID=2976005 RepID=UPI002E2BCFD3|nr:MFS transporter [Rhodococcus sp. NBC_00297]